MSDSASLPHNNRVLIGAQKSNETAPLLTTLSKEYPCHSSPQQTTHRKQQLKLDHKFTMLLTVPRIGVFEFLPTGVA